MRRLVIFLIICSAPGQIILAQLPSTFQIRYYTTENGLPSNGIKGLVWDGNTGLLWMSTEAGIVRFDGVYFKTFDKANTPFIASERMWYMVRNNSDTIYTSDLTGNIIKVHQNNLVFRQRTRDVNMNDGLYAMVASDTLLTYKFNHPGKGSYPGSFKNIISISDTSLLVIDPTNVYMVQRSAEDQIPLKLDNETISEGFKIDSNIFLISQDKNIFQFEGPTQKLRSVEVNPKDNFLEYFKNNKLHFFSQNGGSGYPIAISGNLAWRLKYDHSKIIPEEICDAVPGNSRIDYLQYSASKKMLFIGTNSKGLIVIGKNAVTPMKRREEGINQTNAYYAQVELPGGSILTNAGHVIGPTDNNKLLLPVHGRFNYNTYITSDSLLWYSQEIDSTADRYLHVYNYKTRQTIIYSKIRTGDNFGVVYSNHKIYVGTHDGLGELQNDTVHYLFRKEGLNPSEMTEITNGVFAVATCGGLIRVNTITSVVDTLLSIPDCIRTVWKFNDYLFIGTYGKGYYIYGNGKIKAMPLDKNSYLLYTHCFVPDKKGYCWISTNRGLFKARLADLINSFEKNIPDVYYHYFGRNDGMDITEMNGGCTPCALQMKNGIISFPTMDGLLWVDPENAVTNLPTGSIFIDEITADDKKINPDSFAIKSLPADTKEMEVKLAFPAWCNKENIYIDYELNNSGKWERLNTNNDPVIRLYGMAAGHYTLRIRKINGFGVNNYSYKELHFSIAVPWYQNWWFFVLLLLLAVSLGRLFVKLRTRQYEIRQLKLEAQVYEKTKELLIKNEILEKNDTIKTRLISIISHDMITPLKFLTVAGKNLLQKGKVMPEGLQQQTISEMTKTSQDLQLLSTNILNWIKYQNENRRMVKETFNVYELIGQVVSVLNSWAKQKQLDLSNEIDKELMLYQYAEPLRILVYNLVSNAINFSETGNIVIRSLQEADHLIISVKDEGVGMTAEQVENIMGNQVIISTTSRADSRKGHGLGYIIIKDLIKMIGAEIKINSEPEKGTDVVVRIPSK